MKCNITLCILMSFLYLLLACNKQYWSRAAASCDIQLYLSLCFLCLFQHAVFSLSQQKLFGCTVQKSMSNNFNFLFFYLYVI
jgi:hypothetical protein